MQFVDFIKEGKVRKATKDRALARSLMSMSDNLLKYLENQEINDISASPIMTNYYEALREVIEAICAIDGYKVYSHEAFTYYLKQKDEGLARRFDRFRKIRNQINYYGKAIGKDEAIAYKADILKMIDKLREDVNCNK